MNKFTSLFISIILLSILQLNAQNISIEYVEKCLNGIYTKDQIINKLKGDGYKSLTWEEIKKEDNFGYDFYFDKTGKRKSYELIKPVNGGTFKITITSKSNYVNTFSWNDGLYNLGQYYSYLKSNGYKEDESNRLIYGGRTSFYYINNSKGLGLNITVDQGSKEVVFIFNKKG
jgi:hypothetical protein